MALAMNWPRVRTWLHLVRWQNLTMAAACLLIFRTILLLGAQRNGGELILGHLGFLALTLALICLMAIGYLHNDLDDEETDRINRPHDRLRPDLPPTAEIRRSAHGLALLGAFSSLVAAWDTGLWPWLPAYSDVYFLLVAYTRHLKPLAMVANMTIALLIALVPLMLLIPEWPWISLAASNGRSPIFGIFLMFAAFAFFGNLFRELVKDLEDIPGDSAAGIRTLPLRIGLFPAKAITAMAGLAFAALLLWVALYDPWHLDAGYAFVAMAVVQIILSIVLLKTRKKEGFRFISQAAKGYQAAGLLLALSLGLAHPIIHS